MSPLEVEVLQIKARRHQERLDKGLDDDGNITPEQFEELRERFNPNNDDNLRSGWSPAWWHWRRYRLGAIRLLARLRLVHVVAYDTFYWRLPRRKGAWKPMQTKDAA